MPSDRPGPEVTRPAGARSPAGLPAAYHSGWAAEPTFCHLSTPFLILSLPNLGGNYYGF